jgi:hypothetical protein
MYAIYMKTPELVQPVEKKGKCFKSIVPIICRPKNWLDRLNRKKITNAAC